MINHKIKVLYLDDESNNLNVFKAGFRFNFDVYTAKNVAESLTILQNEKIHIIIADQKMPHMTGVQFFESILYEYPDPMRILITGYSDIEAVIDAINKGQVYRYIQKPWNNHELILTIESAYETYLSRVELKKTNVELQKTNEELSRFVYSTSHDLKAPIMSIMGLLKVAQLDVDNQNPEKYFKMIGTSVKQLDAFVHNIINYYKNNKIIEEQDIIDFATVIKNTLDVYAYMENRAETVIEVNVDQKIPFLSDKFRLKVILNNLISNALKYQNIDEPNKKITINCEVTENHAYVSIVDNGIGINEKYIENVFKMFYRATRESTGSGIGLYIVKEAVERLQGIITIESTEGVGTAFNLTLPNYNNASRNEKYQLSLIHEAKFKK